MAYIRDNGEFYVADSFDRAGELNYCTLANSAVSKGDVFTTSVVADVVDFRHELGKVIDRVAALESGNASSCAEKTNRFKAAWKYNRRAYKTLAG